MAALQGFGEVDKRNSESVAKFSEITAQIILEMEADLPVFDRSLIVPADQWM